jgi:nucleolin
MINQNMENTGNTGIPDDMKLDDARKVFVSRVPRSFDGSRLQLEMEKVLGENTIESSTILWDNDEDRSRGSAFVVFKDKQTRSDAVKAGFFKVSVGKSKTKIMHVAEVERQREGRGRDGGVCFLWKQGNCTHGDTCRFAHTGEGSCKIVTESKKKKKCFAFKKGKCKLGDKCNMLHVTSSASSSSSSSSSSSPTASSINSPPSNNSNEPKPCFNWQKKGKCRKGDACTYKHETKEESIAREMKKSKKDKKSSKKRKRQETATRESGPNYAPLTVRVFGLAYTSTEKDIRDFFSACGTIVELDIPLWEDSGRIKGFCQITFLSEENVDRAVQLDGKELNGRWLRIQRGKMFSSWGVKKGRAIEEEDESSSSALANAKRLKDSKTIFLGNIDWKLSKRVLRRACDALYGKVSSIRLQKPKNSLDPATGEKINNSGFAHVTFDTIEIAEKAVSMNGEELLGRKATVDWA